MYISFIDKKNNKVKTRDSDCVTKKNKIELEKRSNYFYYLYDKALQILKNGDVSERYRIEYITKKNNNKRRLDIPDDELMNYQKEVAYFFGNKLNLIFPKSVYGYVSGRNAKMMAEVHKNQYQVIKLDIKDFFPNCTMDFLMKAMNCVYPFCLLEEEFIKTIIKPCFVFYDGDFRLPQGAPTSPILSNIAMIPIDYALESVKLTCARYSYVYTRFADDIIISHERFNFLSNISAEERLLKNLFGEEIKESKKISNKKEIRVGKIVYEVIEKIESFLKFYNPNFELNKEKTKVLNTDCGNVWMLGVSIGGNSVKVGNVKKQRLKAALWTFLNDCKNNVLWSKKDLKHMLGNLSYAKFIEPDFVNNLIAKYEQKTGLVLKKEVKKILCM